MIGSAALLVLLGLGLFVAGLLTGQIALYWACVAVCVVAAVLLVLARRRLGGSDPTTPAAPAAAPGATDPLAAATPVAAGGAPAQHDETAAPRAGTLSEPTPAAGHAAADGHAAGGPSAASSAAGPSGVLEDPPVEEVEVTDLLLVVDLTDEVLVIDEHPRYHLAGCRYLAGREAIPLPLDEARADGFTPCAVCAPDRTLADRARARR